MEDVLFELGKISAGRDGRAGRRVFPYFHEEKYVGIKIQDTFQKIYLSKLCKEDKL